MDRAHLIGDRADAADAGDEIGHFVGVAPAQEGFEEAREWLALASTKEELELSCQTSRAKRQAA
jgi:hypothetical protein